MHFVMEQWQHIKCTFVCIEANIHEYFTTQYPKDETKTALFTNKSCFKVRNEMQIAKATKERQWF